MGDKTGRWREFHVDVHASVASMGADRWEGRRIDALVGVLTGAVSVGAAVVHVYAAVVKGVGIELRHRGCNDTLGGDGRRCWYRGLASRRL